jgi:2-polyprenyl-3-methyl-5-hydroxy-6-metoxy-1,4-benzoquinol methylase
MTLAQTVRDQYEAYPYPPRDPAREREQLRSTLLGQVALVNYVLWGGRRRPDEGFRVLDAGCGTGDNAVFIAEQLRGTGAEVVGLDLSEASLSVAAARAEARGLDVRFVRGSITDLPNLGLGLFDYVVSPGVLHHLPSPEAGLAAIRDVLAPGGGAGIMVYGQYGRTAIYQLQELLRLVAPDSLPAEQRVRIAKDVIGGLKADHWASLGRNSYAGEIELHGDAGLFDALLHSTDRAYTVPELYGWAQGAGMRLIRHVIPTLYDPSFYAPRLDCSGLGPVEREATAELLHGRMMKHSFFVTRESTEVPAAPDPADESAIPQWLNYDAGGLIKRQLELQPGFDLEFEGLRFQQTLDPFRRGFLKRVDGRTSAAAILAALQGKFPKLSRQELSAKWRELHDGLQRFNLLGLYPAA